MKWPCQKCGLLLRPKHRNPTSDLVCDEGHLHSWHGICYKDYDEPVKPEDCKDKVIVHPRSGRTHVKLETGFGVTLVALSSLWASKSVDGYSVGDNGSDEAYGLSQEEAKRIYNLLEVHCVH